MGGGAIILLSQLVSIRLASMSGHVQEWKGSISSSESWSGEASPYGRTSKGPSHIQYGVDRNVCLGHHVSSSMILFRDNKQLTVERLHLSEHLSQSLLVIPQ